MKQLIRQLPTFALFLLFTTSFTKGPIMPNPSVEYAKFLGYKVEIRQSTHGGTDGYVIFPDNSECEAWYFYRGICGQKFSYCALKGCIAENVQEENYSYCTCSCSDSLGRKIVIKLKDFMEQHGDTLIKNNNGID